MRAEVVVVVRVAEVEAATAATVVKTVVDVAEGVTKIGCSSDWELIRTTEMAIGKTPDAVALSPAYNTAARQKPYLIAFIGAFLRRREPPDTVLRPNSQNLAIGGYVGIFDVRSVAQIPACSYRW